VQSAAHRPESSNALCTRVSWK